MEKEKKVKNTHKKEKTTTKENKVVKKATKKVKQEPKKEIIQAEKVVELTNNKCSKFYYSYTMRIAVNVVLFLTLFLAGIFFLLKSFSLEEANVVNYSEISNLDYKVYLKPNDFYTDEYLGKNMIYVANLIDKIKVDFNYDFMIEKEMDLEFEYDITAKLVIQDENADKTFYEKTYTLLNKKQNNLINDMHKEIKESITIDYEKYNKIANSFKTTYGLNTKSKLIVYFNINKSVLNQKQDNSLITGNTDNMIINIPLSEKAIDINLDYKDIRNKSRVIDNSKIIMSNIVYLIVTIVAINLSIVFLLKLIRLIRKSTKKKNVYDQYIKKLLNEYDRLIVETTTPPILDKETDGQIFEIKEFTELLDVRDNLKAPIMYYIITPHEKCQFYIKEDNRTYLTTIKRVDLEEKNEKK